MADNIYCYPNSNILVNKLGIHDLDLLNQAERLLSSRRLLQLQDHPISGSYDYQHLKNIHAYIFQDIYDWAGKERTVDIAKGNMFCNARFLPEQANQIFAQLHSEDLLKNLPYHEFIKRLSFFFGEINALHPFREGNGRTQREFFRILSLNAGYSVDYTKITNEEMLTASIDSFMCQYHTLEVLFNKAIKRSSI